MSQVAGAPRRKPILKKYLKPELKAEITKAVNALTRASLPVTKKNIAAWILRHRASKRRKLKKRLAKAKIKEAATGSSTGFSTGFSLPANHVSSGNPSERSATYAAHASTKPGHPLLLLSSLPEFKKEPEVKLLMPPKKEKEPERKLLMPPPKATYGKEATAAIERYLKEPPTHTSSSSKDETILVGDSKIPVLKSSLPKLREYHKKLDEDHDRKIKQKVDELSKRDKELLRRDQELKRLDQELGKKQLQLSREREQRLEDNALDKIYKEIGVRDLRQLLKENGFQPKQYNSKQKHELFDLYLQTEEGKKHLANAREELKSTIDLDGSGLDLDPNDPDVTSGTQITKWMSKVPGFQGVLARDQHLKVSRAGGKVRTWIKNLDPLGQPGSHWIAIAQAPDSLEYYDPLGDKPPKDILKQLLELKSDPKAKVKINYLQNQNTSKNTCGFHAMKFVAARASGMSFSTASGYDDLELDKSTRGEQELSEWRSQFPGFRQRGGFLATGPSPRLEHVLRQYEAEEMSDMSVEKAPVSKYIRIALNIVTLGGFNDVMKKMKIDDLVHTSLVFTVRGKRFRLEKNDTIQMIPYSSRPDTQSSPVANPKKSLKEFFDRASKSQGSKFFQYDPVDNNCQVFVVVCLRANGLLTPTLKNFTIQDVRSVFKSFPLVSRIARGITGLANRLRTFLGV